MNECDGSDGTGRRTCRLILLAALALAGCDSSDDDGAGGGVSPGSQGFVDRARAVELDRVELHAGHVPEGEGGERVQVDPSGLRSGDLVTISVYVENVGELEDYAIEVQLLPESIYSRLSPGDTLGEVVNEAVNALEGEGIVTLGTVRLEGLGAGLVAGDLRTKLPTLVADATYRIAVSAPLAFLADGGEIDADAAALVPVLIDERVLSIARLERPRVEFAGDVHLDSEEAFAVLEAGVGFDEERYSIDPLFSTSVTVDLASFRDTEEVALSLVQVRSDGGELPMGLLGFDANGTPRVGGEARFPISSDGMSATVLPLVAHAPPDTYRALLEEATPIANIADADPPAATFRVSMSALEDGRAVGAARTTLVTLPLVSVPGRERVQRPGDLIRFTVLRAGVTNELCASVFFDIDTQLLGEVDSKQSIGFTRCPEPDRSFAPTLWRYDPETKQIVNIQSNRDGDSFCVTAEDTGPPIEGPRRPIAPKASAALPVVPLNPNEVILTGCHGQADEDWPARRFQLQRFELEGRRIRLAGYPAYLRLDASGATPVLGLTYVASEATDFHRDADGLDVGDDGRLLSVGKFYEHTLGSRDTAQARVSYGAEAFVDYLPVIGFTARGSASIGVSLFSRSLELVEVSFDARRHLPKKLALTGRSYPDRVVGNGATVKVNLADYEVVDQGSIVESEVTEFYTTENVGEVMAGALDVPVEEQTYTRLNHRMEEGFVRSTVLVVGIPVTVKGGVSGRIDLALSLAAPDVGLDVRTGQGFELGGYLSAEVDALVASAGIEGEIRFVDQTLDFTAAGGFATSQAEPTRLAFDARSFMDSGLKLVKGKVSAFAEYPDKCWCFPIPFKMKRVQSTLYQSGYLFERDGRVFSADIGSAIIDY